MRRCIWSAEVQRIATLVVPSLAVSTGTFARCSDSKTDAPQHRGSLRWSSSPATPAATSSAVARRPTKDYRSLVNDKCLKTIATLMNDVVDTDAFSEEEEQDIFEMATVLVLDEIAGILPSTYVEMIRGRNTEYFEKTLKRKDIEYFEKRLNEFVRLRLRLPFLSELEEKVVFQCIVHVLVTAMVEQKGVEHALMNHQKAIVVEVFMKSMIGIFVDEERRMKCVGDILEHIKGVPFVPQPVIGKVVAKVLELVGSVIEVSLKDALDQILLIRVHEQSAGQSDMHHDVSAREAFLKVVPVLSSMDDAQRSKLAGAMTLKTFRKGEHIIRKGDSEQEFYIMQQGFASASVGGCTVSHYGPGSYFGEVNIFRQEGRSADVVATTDVTLLCVNKEDFLNLLKPALGLMKRLPPPPYPQSEFLGHLRLSLYNHVSEQLPRVLQFLFPGTVLALVDEILLQVEDQKLDKAVSTLTPSEAPFVAA